MGKWTPSGVDVPASYQDQSRPRFLRAARARERAFLKVSRNLMRAFDLPAVTIGAVVIFCRRGRAAGADFKVGCVIQAQPRKDELFLAHRPAPRCSSALRSAPPS